MAESKNTPTKTGDDNKKAPTAQEAMFFFAIVKHTKNKADIDWDGVAQEQGFKNADVAKVRFGQVKRKLGINSDATSTPKKTATTPTKVTKPAFSRAGGRAGAKGKKGKVKKEVDTEDDDNVKDEHRGRLFGSPIKQEEHDAEAQLQADMDAMINHDPF